MQMEKLTTKGTATPQPTETGNSVTVTLQRNAKFSAKETWLSHFGAVSIVIHIFKAQLQLQNSNFGEYLLPMKKI